MEGLRDIKDVVAVHDNSLWIFLSLVIAVVLLLALAIYLFKNRRIRKKRKTPKELAKERLKSIDFSDTKGSIYTFCEDGEMFVDENNRSFFEDIVKETQTYKYKRDIPDLDEALKEHMKKFIGGIK
jgi:predicted membrane protein